MYQKVAQLRSTARRLYNLGSRRPRSPGRCTVDAAAEDRRAAGLRRRPGHSGQLRLQQDKLHLCGGKVWPLQNVQQLRRGLQMCVLKLFRTMFLRFFVLFCAILCYFVLFCAVLVLNMMDWIAPAPAPTPPVLNEYTCGFNSTCVPATANSSALLF